MPGWVSGVEAAAALEAALAGVLGVEATGTAASPAAAPGVELLNIEKKDYLLPGQPKMRPVLNGR
jgi:hypothetical protein